MLGLGLHQQFCETTCENIAVKVRLESLVIRMVFKGGG